MFIFIGVFTGTVLETTGERIWGSMWRVESVSTLHTRVKLNCVKWVSLLFEINKNMSIAFSIFDFYTLIHMLCHIASYICFIITILTPIFFYFQNSILMSSKVTHSSCTILTMITCVESGWLSHPMFLSLVGSHGSITTKGYLKITFGDITLSGCLFVNSLSMRQKTSPLFENFPTIITSEFFVLMITCNMPSQIHFPFVHFVTKTAFPFLTHMYFQLVSS